LLSLIEVKQSIQACLSGSEKHYDPLPCTLPINAYANEVSCHRNIRLFLRGFGFYASSVAAWAVMASAVSSCYASAVTALAVSTLVTTAVLVALAVMAALAILAAFGIVVC
jgi:amino acid transporter